MTTDTEETITLTKSELQEILDRIPGPGNPEILKGWDEIHRWMRDNYGWTWYKIRKYRWELIDSTAVGYTYERDDQLHMNRKWVLSDSGQLRKWVRAKWGKRKAI